ncbi:MAG: DeoR/GlpR family DNA-binding transcription regulator [Anaerolineae bacterium]|jgi:DeoR/GlpR family transcriptional regulator of sugar metabolism|nr:DeoR/GlpR family DNA-binding transcription regulator [Anaerolineae bacterium]
MDTQADIRRHAILDELAQRQAVRVSELSQAFGVSEVSVRRDLSYLERQGLLRRIHGGAVPVPHVQAPSVQAVAGTGAHAAEKANIGRAAAELVRPGDRLLFDSGTTVLEVARHLPPDLRESGNLTVITSSLPIVRELGPCKGIHLILLGGVFLPQYEVVVGPPTIAQLSELHADKLFLGADGLTFARGVTTANMLEAEVDRAAIAAASQVILVADSSKIGLIGLTTIMPLADVEKLITDGGAPPDFVGELRRQGVEVILV